MKYLVVSLFLIAVLTVGCIFSAVYVSNVVSETERMLKQAYDSITENRYPPCQSAIDMALNHWKKHDQTMVLLIHQDELGRVKEELSGLQATLMAGDEDDFLDSCARLISNLQHLGNMQWPCVRNFL